MYSRSDTVMNFFLELMSQTQQDEAETLPRLFIAVRSSSVDCQAVVTGVSTVSCHISGEAATVGEGVNKDKGWKRSNGH